MTDYANGSTPRILLRAYLSSDHLSDATGKTIAVTISKNGGAFGNPAAGATNATEIANGWYYVTLGAGDTDTNGPLIIRGTAASTDTTEIAHEVVPATNGRLSALPATACTTNASLLTSGTGTAQISNSSGQVILQTGTGTGQLDFTSGVVKCNNVQWLGGTIPAVNVTGVPIIDVKYLLGTVWSTPTVAGIPNVNVKTWNDLTTVALPLVPTTSGRTLDVSAGGEAGLDWANIGSPTTSVNLSGTSIKDLSASGTLAIWNNLTVNLSLAGSIGLALSDHIIDYNYVLNNQIPAGMIAAQADIPTANQNADALLDRTAGVETNRTLRQSMRLMLSVLCGKISGAATATNTFRDTNDTKDRVTSTVDADGNRSAVTLDGS